MENISGYDSDYQVSNLGNLRSLKFVKMKIIKSSINGSGYKIKKLYKDNISTFYRVHRLVAEAFIPNPESKEFINHKNGVKSDNRVDNLEWVTSKENAMHSCHTLMNVGGHPPTKSVIQYDSNTKPIKIWDSIAEAARYLKVDSSTIIRCCQGKQKTSKNFYWEYLEIDDLSTK